VYLTHNSTTSNTFTHLTSNVNDSL
jgi:hypothetical protein